MSFPKILSEAVAAASPALAVAIQGLLFAAIAAATKYLLGKAKTDRERAVILRVDVAAEAAVRQVSQTFADAAKAKGGGTLTPQEAEAAAALALSTIKKNLGDAGLAEIKKVLSPESVDSMLSTHAEAAVHKLAGEPPPAPATAPSPPSP